jgi:hypothetical protein
MCSPRDFEYLCSAISCQKKKKKLKIKIRIKEEIGGYRREKNIYIGGPNAPPILVIKVWQQFCALTQNGSGGIYAHKKKIPRSSITLIRTHEERSRTPRGRSTV